MLNIKSFAAAAVISILTFSAAAASTGGEVNVYSYRQPFLIKPMFDAFTSETGIKVNVVFADQGLVERLKQEFEKGKIA